MIRPQDIKFYKVFIEGCLSILPFRSKMPIWRPLFTDRVNINSDWRFISIDLRNVLSDGWNKKRSEKLKQQIHQTDN